MKALAGSPSPPLTPDSGLSMFLALGHLPQKPTAHSHAELFNQQTEPVHEEIHRLRRSSEQNQTWVLSHEFFPKTFPNRHLQNLHL